MRTDELYRSQTVPDANVADELEFDGWPEEKKKLAQRVLMGGIEVDEVLTPFFPDPSE